MRRAMGIMVVGVLVGLAWVLAQGNPTKVSMIESWFIHAESIGDPVAVDKGFYKAAGLDVTVVPGGPGLSPIDRVMAESKAGKLVFGIDYPYNLLEARQKQKLPLVILAADFQDSAMQILSWKPIDKVSDISGKFATWIGYDKPIKAAIGKDWESKIQIVNQQGDPATLGGWLAKQYNYASAMIYNEVMVAQQQAKEKYYQYSYKEFGVDWPENVLFTTEDVLKKYPNEVKKFVEARYKGYQYALANPEEAGKILAKYNPNLDIPFELKGLEQIKKIMVTPETQKNGLGYVDVAKLQKMAQQLQAAGILESASLAGFVQAVPSGVKP
ncbi:MAG: ABC transporter substrate-binding protein [Thermaceae bacterium]|nr:ABC transporter substrate-binding protein [Thermaceae bacterium]